MVASVANQADESASAPPREEPLSRTRGSSSLTKSPNKCIQNARHRLSSWPVTGSFMFVANLCMGNKLQDFFHPNHVVPSVKFAATLMEGSDFSEN